MVTNSEEWSANQVKLEATTCEKDIDAHVDDNLSFKDHIYTKIKKPMLSWESSEEHLTILTRICLFNFLEV